MGRFLLYLQTPGDATSGRGASTSGSDVDKFLESSRRLRRESQRSHLSTFTMILKDKFHSPKIKRTPTKNRKPQPEPAAKSTEKPVNKLLEGPLFREIEFGTKDFAAVSRLEEHEKDVVSALKYFKAIVDKMMVEKKVLEMLPGSASKVLEAILPLVQVEARLQHSSALSSCHSRVYQSLANLIRWADQVMLDGIDLDDQENVASVKNVIKAVLDGVKELVKLTIEKQEHPSPTSPNKPAPPVTTAERWDGCTRLHEADACCGSSPHKTAPELHDEEVAPPKPPLPEAKVAELSPPPALPPKKRQSAPSPTPVAVVAPMSRGSSLPCSDHRQHEYFQRRFSGGSHSYGGDSPRLSPCSSMGKLSKSDEQLSSMEQDSGQCSRNTSCETLDNTETYDPDYDFLHQDLSVGDNLPPIPVGGCLSPLPESHSESSSPVPGQHPSHPHFSAPLPQQSEYWTPQSNQANPILSSRVSAPPALPQKKRYSTSTSSFSDGGSRVLYERHHSHYDNLSEEELHPTPPFPLFTPISPMPQTNGGVFVSQFISSENTDVPCSPPPLPEKKSRNILQYMQFVEDYSEPQPSVFYQMPQSESIYEQRNRLFQEVYGFNDSFSSTDSVHEPLLPPALPPKQRQLVRTPSRAVSVLMGVDHTCFRRQKPTEVTRSDEENVDELSLIDHKEIMSRITLKQENDDGPDVRAGSGDILLVHATETDRKDLVLYCEAFLTTYRTFITPEDLIKKLHYRYPFKKRVSKNTFFVLVRVVDELCLVELTEDILKQLMDLVFTLVCSGELSLARVLRKNILDKVEQKKLLRYTNSLKPLAARGVSARPGTLHDFRSHEIADQLTLLDAELFYKIEIPEVLLWAKEQNEEKSPNLTQFTEHFNNMSYWVRSLIIQQEKAQDREKLLLKFIKIMKHLRKLNNFNSYLAILSALDSAPIRRLEWQKQTSEGLEEYCTLIDSSSSFRAYRAALAEVEPPCIPYLGLILQDLTFVHLGNPDLIDGKVNFSKRWQQFNILDSMRRFQQVHYELKRNEDIISFFNDFSDHLAEEALWELSLKIKPRNITRRKTDREEKT
uniref:CRK SH3-binding GNRP n=1 Tax=Nothobranchius furzeri TaxID=105023 RepID=A0A8C6KVV1_NOTFU